jgi:hypothetical protein
MSSPPLVSGGIAEYASLFHTSKMLPGQYVVNLPHHVALRATHVFGGIEAFPAAGKVSEEPSAVSAASGRRQAHRWRTDGNQAACRTLTLGGFGNRMVPW